MAVSNYVNLAVSDMTVSPTITHFANTGESVGLSIFNASIFISNGHNSMFFPGID